MTQTISKNPSKEIKNYLLMKNNILSRWTCLEWTTHIFQINSVSASGQKSRFFTNWILSDFHFKLNHPTKFKIHFFHLQCQGYLVRVLSILKNQNSRLTMILLVCQILLIRFILNRNLSFSLELNLNLLILMDMKVNILIKDLRKIIP